ncbi:HNH endonuclease [Escherichia coli]|uniref:HNH endonuclease signature motif containing protein n=1 Tax=Escherichia coli TaxID=562 RepID=UPI001F1FA37A|nr:HNH endonuclease signature motif containing protein [Escherichia coli]MCF7264387.1 HNH endonuclease [Escherichia coli]
MLSKKIESNQKMTNCPHCGVIVKASNLNNHIASRCVAIFGVKPKKLPSPSLHVHKTIKHVTKVEVTRRNISNMMKYTPEQLRALAAGKPLPPVAPVEKVVKQSYNVAKPTILPVKPVAPVIIVKEAEVEVEVEVEVKSKYFNASAYQKALRTMTQSEAYKIATDKERSTAFLSPLEPIITPEQPITITEAVETPVTSVANDSSYVATRSDSIEQALFADRLVRTRTNQNDFKERVAANFGYRCAITDSGEALEAAHIEPVGTGNNNTSNGVLMLACLHRLFDAGLMAIDPESLTVHFKDDCTYFAKSMLEGKKLNDHSVPLNKSGLLERWLSFNV